MKSKRAIGDIGEEIAVQYLLDKGYEIIERNFTIRGGEIDIIAIKDSIHHFIEVKYHRSLKFGHPLEAITDTKADLLEYTLLEYCGRNEIDPDNCQLEMIAILDLDGEREITHCPIE